ncbi:HNH endonuclease signature motif containing protein [Microbacterium flavum]|uniref:DUF222 domain-containing protein n=1 Tax=Microbacterium flavum TaxID=415216 RepID=A0ABS5XVP8_9MICO|nr:HNH endonuclease signature motif containing protein [Microbacterium flavum]MBT8798612.1 DUF222 domain-containing protein [Microbacterium flavum]
MSELAQQLGAIGGIQRLIEALLVEATGEILRRSENPVRDERMTSHLGCRDVGELLQTLTRNDGRSAARLQRAARAVRGTLLPEVAAQLQTIFDAHLAPAVVFDDPCADASGGDGPAPYPRDERTRPQKQHDALAAALAVAASSGLLPTIGGHAPTLVVSVDAEDLVSGRGYAHLQGDEQPVSIGVARHIACGGVIQRISTRPDGRIVAIGTEERVFHRHQRRAIALRDGGCVIPGCGVPAGWCEIHHVAEHARGGTTHTDNGVLLCWYHHRFLDRIGWQLRMNAGVPEIKAPPWFGIDHRWRAVTTSPVRLRKRLLKT